MIPNNFIYKWLNLLRHNNRMAPLKHWYSGTHFIVTALSMASVIISGIINYQGNGSCRLCSDWINITQTMLSNYDRNGKINGTNDIVCSNASSSIDLGYFMTMYNAILMGIQVLFFMFAFTYFTGTNYHSRTFEKHLRLTLGYFHTFHIIVLTISSSLIISFKVSILERTACSRILLYWYYAYLVVNLLHSSGIIGKVVREYCKNRNSSRFHTSDTESRNDTDEHNSTYSSYSSNTYGTGANKNDVGTYSVTF